MQENKDVLNKVIQQLEKKGIFVEKTKSRNDIWHNLQKNHLTIVKLGVR
ncbi:Lmo0850 family protein [Listeria cornellensis]|nr:Lmo0850 family protein [Listeria cornellensis]